MLPIAIDTQSPGANLKEYIEFIDLIEMEAHIDRPESILIKSVPIVIDKNLIGAIDSIIREPSIRPFQN